MSEALPDPRPSTARNKALVVIAAGVPALAYLFYVVYYAVDVPRADDWGSISLVVKARNGHLPFGEMWSQYVAGRPFVPRLVVVAFGVFDHLNEKSIILFSAGIFICSFVLLLLLFRAYLSRRLTFLPVFSLAVVWFSVTDPWNIFWASAAVTAYLVVFFFVTMTYVLLVPRRWTNLFFALGILAAVAASLSYLQGFVVWPLGLICILWASPWDRRTYIRSAAWLSAAVLTTAVFSYHYGFSNTTCLSEGGQPGSCSFGASLGHPADLLRYLFLLVGNVVPTSPAAIQARHANAYELLGAVICVVAVFVVVQSVRERRTRAVPLPLLLIAFALSFDVMVALGHLGVGLLTAGNNRFTLSNVILVAGIVMYAWGHVPSWRDRRAGLGRRELLPILGAVVLVGFVIVQCIVATRFGVSNARDFRAQNHTTARVIANLYRIPGAKRGCYLESSVVGPPLSALLVWRAQLKDDGLSLFQPATLDGYQAEGPPSIAGCEDRAVVTTTVLPAAKVGAPYSAPLTAAGGDRPYTWSVAPGLGSLPAGLALDASTGVISGAPVAPGTYTFYVTTGVDEWRQGVPVIPNSDGISIVVS